MLFCTPDGTTLRSTGMTGGAGDTSKTASNTDTRTQQHTGVTMQRIGKWCLCCSVKPALWATRVALDSQIKFSMTNYHQNQKKSEESLSRKIRRTLAQIRTNKSPLLLTYKHKIDPHTHPNPLCTFCKIHDHDTIHLFNCTHIPPHLTPTDLWKNPV